jgi:hypothetical protein
MDCLSADERCARADNGLVLRARVGEGLFLFNCDVAILCGIKDFAAFLTFYEFDVILAGDNFDDGMFAGGSHVWGKVNGMDFARLQVACQPRFHGVFAWLNRGEVAVTIGDLLVCIGDILDVHYLGL